MLLFRLFRPALTLGCLLCGLSLAAQTTGEEWFVAGNEKLDANDFVGAIDAYNRAIELIPDADGGYTNRGLAKWQAGDLSGARATSPRPCV